MFLWKCFIVDMKHVLSCDIVSLLQRISYCQFYLSKSLKSMSLGQVTNVNLEIFLNDTNYFKWLHTSLFIFMNIFGFPFCRRIQILGIWNFLSFNRFNFWWLTLFRIWYDLFQSFWIHLNAVTLVSVSFDSS